MQTLSERRAEFIMSWSQIGSTENCRIAASPPSQGGVITSTFLELLIYPIIFFMWRSRVSHDLAVLSPCGHRDSDEVFTSVLLDRNQSPPRSYDIDLRGNRTFRKAAPMFGFFGDL